MGNCLTIAAFDEFIAQNDDDKYVPVDLVPANQIVENIDGWKTFNVEDVLTEYGKLRDKLLMFLKGDEEKYKDPLFPADFKSLFRQGMKVSSDWKYITWKRPQEISSNPRLYVNGVSSEDVCQGALGDCWFLAGCGAIAFSQTAMRRVIPSDQYFYGHEKYTGAFHFRFWRYGEWVDVIIDDLLPVMKSNGSNVHLCFAQSSERNEYWSALVEKAYAKLNGCYKSIDGGFTSDALEDLTGGMVIEHELGSEAPRNLPAVLLRAMHNETFVCAGINGGSGGGGGEVPLGNTGLLGGHAYSILDFTKVTLSNGRREYLIKVRNPWGGEFEWKNKFSDGSPIWRLVSEEDKKNLGIINKPDGEWWMPYDEFVHYFSTLSICTLGPDYDQDGKVTGDRWKLSSIHGMWSGEPGTGGSQNNRKSYSKNPQYFFEILKPDNYDPQGKATVLIGLMQKNRRSSQLRNLSIGFAVYKSTPRRTERHSYIQCKKSLMDTDMYTDLREVVMTGQLRPGSYFIVPATFEAEQQCEFLIRIYTENDVGEMRLLQ